RPRRVGHGNAVVASGAVLCCPRSRGAAGSRRLGHRANGRRAGRRGFRLGFGAGRIIQGLLGGRQEAAAVRQRLRLLSRSLVLHRRAGSRPQGDVRPAGRTVPPGAWFQGRGRAPVHPAARGTLSKRGLKETGQSGVNANASNFRRRNRPCKPRCPRLFALAVPALARSNADDRDRWWAISRTNSPLTLLASLHHPLPSGDSPDGQSYAVTVSAVASRSRAS